ncbi:hypothetical protein Tco_0959932 [Tanacetum coccineum]
MTPFRLLRQKIQSENGMKQKRCRSPNVRLRYGYITKRTNTKQNGQNRAREWKEYKKTKPKAYLSLMGQPKPLTHLTPIKATLAILNILIGEKDMEAIKGYDDGFMNQGLRLVDEDAPEVLEPSSSCYK